MMFHKAFHDLLKPQWLSALAVLKTSGGMPVSELSRALGASYMTVKQHCEDLTKRGYLMRSRIPRTEIGRPEIFYRLSEKAEAMFPVIAPAFTLDLMDHARHLFGETAPEKLLFQHFQKQEAYWKEQVSKGETLVARAELFAKLRGQEGCFTSCIDDQGEGQLILREFHNPMRPVFEKFPRALSMEVRAMEAALDCRLKREVVLGLGDLPSYVDFTLQ